jgi:transposase
MAIKRKYDRGMQLRYTYRLYPTPGQRDALARAFGCARVVFNGPHARQEAHAAGLPYLTDAELSARLTAAKATPERTWLGEVSSIAVEDLAVGGLARTRMAKSVHDAGWSAFTAMLEYKARRYGREFRRIGRFEPTSQVCSACGAKDGPKPLHVRVWQCPACGAWLDRDINAAVNVARAAGLAVAACGAQVRPGAIPAQRGEAGTLPKSRWQAA